MYIYFLSNIQRHRKRVKIIKKEMSLYFNYNDDNENGKKKKKNTQRFDEMHVLF